MPIPGTRAPGSPEKSLKIQLFITNVDQQSENDLLLLFDKSSLEIYTVAPFDTDQRLTKIVSNC